MGVSDIEGRKKGQGSGQQKMVIDVGKQVSRKGVSLSGKLRKKKLLE